MKKIVFQSNSIRIDNTTMFYNSFKNRWWYSFYIKRVNIPGSSGEMFNDCFKQHIAFKNFQNLDIVILHYKYWADLFYDNS